MSLLGLLGKLLGHRNETPAIPNAKAGSLEQAVALIQQIRDACRSEDRARIEAAIATASKSSVDPAELKQDLRAADVALQLIAYRERLAAGESLPVLNHLSTGEPCYFRAPHVWRNDDSGSLTIAERGIIFDGDKQISIQWQKVWTLEVSTNYLIIHRTNSENPYEFQFGSESEAKLAHLIGLSLWKKMSSELETKERRSRTPKKSLQREEANVEESASSETNAPVGTTIEFPSSSHFGVALVGESRRQSTLRSLAGDRLKLGQSVVFTAAIVPEPKNSFDPNAIAVFVQRGGQIGYLSREDAIEYKAVSAALVARNAVGLCRARLIGGTDAKPSIGVMLDLAEPSQLLQSIAPTDSPF